MTDGTGTHDPATDTSAADPHRVGGAGMLASLGRVTRVLLILGGVAMLGVGLLVVFDPETEGVLRIDAAIEALGSDYVVLAVLGLLAVGLALLLVAARRIRGVSEATPPAVEGVLTATYPGASFDQATGRRLGGFRFGRSERDRRDRLREAAIRATMRADGCSRTDAERRVDEGTWTNDLVAIAYLSASRRGVLRDTLSAGRGIRDGDPADRTVNAIVAKTTGEGSTVRDGDQGAVEDQSTASVRNSNQHGTRGTDRNSDRTANTDPEAETDRTSDWGTERESDQVSDRHPNHQPDGQSTTQEGFQ